MGKNFVGNLNITRFIEEEHHLAVFLMFQHSSRWFLAVVPHKFQQAAWWSYFFQLLRSLQQESFIPFVAWKLIYTLKAKRSPLQMGKGPQKKNKN